MDYYINDFLQSFPKNSLIDKRTAIKAAKELYNTKGTPASYEFLFKILYNSDFDLFYTKDAVLKPSSGSWYIARSLKLSSSDINFLSVDNYRIFGETTKSIAKIENSILASNKIEVFISDIERLFQSGEFVRVVDNNGQDLLFDGQPLRAKIVGQISKITINPNNRGLLYQQGDPVIVYGGLSDANGIGAIAEVNETTTGSIQTINVITQGLGYTEDANTVINISNAPGASAIVGSINPDSRYTANVTFACNNSISLGQYTTIGNLAYTFLHAHPTANANTRLVDALTFVGFTTYPISSVLVTNGGGGISSTPQISATTYYEDDTQNSVDLSNLGILGPIQIINGGSGYQANDNIIFTGGLGYGAYANVTSVNANGTITSISYVYGPDLYPLGGMGYKNTGLPSLTVNSSNGSNSILSVTGILGAGATFSSVVDRVGAITSIRLLNYGEDYVGTPNVSLKVQDIVVSNVSLLNLPRKGDTVYQGANINVATYLATVNSISLLQSYGNPEESLYNLRVFNYTSNPNPNYNIKDLERDTSYIMSNTAFNVNYNENGIRNYGDGTAKATASFLNGLVISDGVYLNESGHLSSYNVLQNEKYNNYTYQITVEKEIEKYRSTLLSLIHPSGTKAIGRYAVKSNSSFNTSLSSKEFIGYPIQHYTGYPGTSATIVSDFNVASNNVININYTAGSNIATFITDENEIELLPGNGPSIRSLVRFVDYTSNTVVVDSNTWLTYANVAEITANAGSNTINITSVTNSYNIINNGIYTDPSYPLKDIVYSGDKVLVANNTQKTVDYVDYENGVIYLTSNLSQNSNSLMSVNRTLETTNVIIWGPIGFTYIPELLTEDGQLLITEDGNYIKLG